MKKYRIYVTEEEIKKIKKIIPNIEFQLLYNEYSRSARSREWRLKHPEEYSEYQKKYRKKIKKLKEKNNVDRQTNIESFKKAKNRDRQLPVGQSRARVSRKEISKRKK